MIRVLIADDNAVIRHGLTSLLAGADGIEVVGEAATGAEAVSATDRLRPDLVLLDVRMPVMDGITALPNLVGRTKVLMLTYSDDEPSVVGAIKSGAAGYLVHGRFAPEDLADSIRGVADGETVLSPAVTPIVFSALRNQGVANGDTAPGALTEREVDVMHLVSLGCSNGAIARELYLSEKTVKNHINRIYAKLGVVNRAQAMAHWLGVKGA